MQALLQLRLDTRDALADDSLLLQLSVDERLILLRQRRALVLVREGLPDLCLPLRVLVPFALLLFRFFLLLRCEDCRTL